MEPLADLMHAMIWYNMCSSDEIPNFRQKVFRIIIWFLLTSGIISSVLYFFKNLSSDLGESLYCVYAIFGIGNSFYVYLFAVFLRHKIRKIFDDLKNIYEHFKKDSSYCYLVDANNLSLKLFYYGRIFSYLFAATSVLISCCSVVWCYYKHKAILMDELFIPYRFVLPWNPKTYTGYPLEVIYSALMALAVLSSAGVIHILFIAMCLHHRAFYKMFRKSAMEINPHDAEQKQTEHLRNLVRAHIMFKKWFEDSAQTYSLIVLVELICSVICSASTILKLDLTIRESTRTLDVILFIVNAVASYMCLFLYGFMGKMSSESYEKMAETLYESNWTELPKQQQKSIILMIQNAQRPIYYTGFGVAILNLETFLKALLIFFVRNAFFRTVVFDFSIISVTMILINLYLYYNTHFMNILKGYMLILTSFNTLLQLVRTIFSYYMIFKTLTAKD